VPLGHYQTGERKKSAGRQPLLYPENPAPRPR
jgi:hypothetical protein